MSKPHENQRDRIDCEQVRALLGAAEDLGPEAEARVREHLRDCSRCQSVATWIPVVDRVAASVPATPPPDPAYFANLRQRVMDEIEKDPSTASTEAASRWRRWFRAPLLAPTAALILLAGVFTVQQWKEEPVQVPVSGPLGRAQVTENRPEAIQEKRRAEDATAPGETGQRGTPARDDGLHSSLDEIAEEIREDADATSETSPPAATRLLRDEAVDGAISSFAAGREEPIAEELVEADEMVAAHKPADAIALEDAAKAEEPARLEKATGAGPDAEAETAPLKDEDVLRGLLVAAREHEGLSSEEAALYRLLNQLESTETPPLAEGSKMKGEMRAQETMALRQSSSPQSASVSMEAIPSPDEMLPVATSVVDSATVLLRARLPHVQDPELKQRIETWLLNQENPEANRE